MESPFVNVDAMLKAVIASRTRFLPIPLEIMPVNEGCMVTDYVRIRFSVFEGHGRSALLAVIASRSAESQSLFCAITKERLA